MSRRRVVVVGGGVAGLVAATWAAREGAEVDLLEAASLPGGRARSRDAAGFRFNLGPHALYLGSEAARELAALGIAARGTRVRSSGNLAWREGRLYALPVGVVSLLSTGLLPLREKLALGRWLAALPALDCAPFDAVPLDVALRRIFEAERVRALARALVRLTSYTHAPALQSAGAALRQLQAALAGVLYLDHGWSQLVESLEAAARQAGARLHVRTRVRALEPRAAGLWIALAEGRSLEADAVVLALGPREASALVQGGADPWLRELAERSVPVRAASLDLGLARLPRPERRVCLGIDAPLYFSVHSIAQGLAPRGEVQVQLARYLAPDEKPDRAALEDELDGFLDVVQPGWRTVVRERQLLTELRVTQAVVTAQQGGLAGRPAVRHPEQPGIYVAGDWVGARGQLVDASFASGSEAGRRAARGD